MRDALFEHQGALEDSDLVRNAKTLGLDAGGTPTFFISGTRHDGSWDLVELLEAL